MEKDFQAPTQQPESNEITFEMVTTKGGDHGTTSLYDGTRILKNSVVLHFLGTMDTFTSFLGLAKAQLHTIFITSHQELIDFTEKVQHKLIILNGMAASPHKKKPDQKINLEDITFLEQFEKSLMSQIHLAPKFIIQGENIYSAYFDVARTFCRQAERYIVELIHQERRSDLQIAQKFLNRLSDVIYIIGRFIDQKI